MWRDGDRIDDGPWRGSIQEVATGRRRYLSAPTDVSEFIAGALRSEAAAAEPPPEASH
jgi:hypothetical protein